MRSKLNKILLSIDNKKLQCFHCQTFTDNEQVEAFKKVPPTYHEWQTLKMYNIIGTLKGLMNFFPKILCLWTIHT